jgi:hypothetical protein
MRDTVTAWAVSFDAGDVEVQQTRLKSSTGYGR